MPKSILPAKVKDNILNQITFIKHNAGLWSKRFFLLLLTSLFIPNKSRRVIRMALSRSHHTRSSGKTLKKTMSGSRCLWTWSKTPKSSLEDLLGGERFLLVGSFWLLLPFILRYYVSLVITAKKFNFWTIVFTCADTSIGIALLTSSF